MNVGQDHDGERHEPLRLSPAEKADGFAAVMGRLKGRTVQEQARLRAQADAAVLGHEAYALGHDYRRRGNYVAAKRWLRVAADHSVPGAEEALEEIDAVTPAAPAAPAASADPAGTAPGTVIPSSSLTREPLGPWAAVVEAMDVAACVQAQARRTTEQARRTAEGLLAQTRRTIQREQAEAMGRLEKARRAVAKLLCEAEHVQQEAWGIREEARRQAEALLEEARGQAQQIVSEARVQAGQIRKATQQHSIGMPSEALPTAAANHDAVSAAYQRLSTTFASAPGPAGRPRAPEKLPLDFAAFHQMHRPGYVREAERWLRSRADAEDAVDDAFVQLAEEWPQILRAENPAAYAWRVVKHRVIDHARARGRRATLTLTGAEDAFEVIEQNLRLFHAIDALPERQRDIVRLRYCEGYTIAEVAHHLGITEAGVRSHERYARRRLREIHTTSTEEVPS